MPDITQLSDEELKQLAAGSQSSSDITQLSDQELVSLAPKSNQSIATMGPSYIKEHPFKTAFDPTSKTLGGPTAADFIDKNFGGAGGYQRDIQLNGNNPYGRAMAFINTFDKGLGGDIIDTLQSPAALVGGPIISKATKMIAPTAAGQAIGKVLNADIGQSIKKGGEYLGKSAANYVTDTVAPKAYQVYQDAVNKFTPQIQQFAKNALNIPESALETMKSQGIAKIEQVRKSLGNNSDNIVQDIFKGMEKKAQEAGQAYKDAYSQTPDNAPIKLNNTKNALGSILERLGFAQNGKLTGLHLEPTFKDTVYNKMVDVYKFLHEPSGILDTTGQPIVTATTKTITKNQFDLVKNMLGDLYKEAPSDLAVSKVRDALYQDGIDSGMKGLDKARNLYRQMSIVEDKFKNSMGDLKAIAQQRKLDNYHSLTEAEKSSLQDLDNYLGIKFTNNLKALSAGKYIDQLKNVNLDTFKTDMVKAINPQWTNTIKAKYADILGPKESNNIIDEIIAHRRGVKVKTGALWAGGAAALAAGGSASKKAWDLIHQ